MMKNIFVTMIGCLLLSATSIQAQDEEVDVTIIQSLKIEPRRDVEYEDVDGVVAMINGAVHISDDLDGRQDENDNLIVNRSVSQANLSNYLLWVEKGIISEDLAIVDPENWADYVFQEDYELTPLDELEHYVRKHKHLPGIPGIKELKEKGLYEVHEMLVGQLKNIEDLLLYTIAQQKQLKVQREQLDKQGGQVELLEQIVENLLNEDN